MKTMTGGNFVEEAGTVTSQTLQRQRRVFTSQRTEKPFTYHRMRQVIMEIGVCRQCPLVGQCRHLD